MKAAPVKPVNLIKNTLFSAVSSLTNLFLLALLLVVGWMLGVERLGVFTFVIAYTTFFEILVDLGLRDIGVRNISREPALTEKYAGNLLVWQLILSGVSFLLMMGIAWALGYPADLRGLIAIFGVEAFLKKIKFTGRIFFQAHNRFEWDTALVLFERMALFIFSLVSLFVFRSLAALAWTFLLVRLVDVALMYGVLHSKIVPLKPALDIRFMRTLQMEALPRGIYIIIFVLLSYADTMMLKQMTNYTQVGLYNSAYKIYEGINIIPSIFYLSVLPRLSQLYKQDAGAYASLSRQVLKILFILALPIAGMLFFGAGDVIHLLYRKSEFMAAAPVLRVLMAGVVLHFPLWMLHMILLASDQQKAILVNGTLAFIFNVVTNAVFIPRFGAEGAAVTTVASQLVLFLLAWRMINRKNFTLRAVSLFSRPFFAAAVPAAVVAVFRLPFSLPLLIGTGLLYTALVVFFKAIDRVEIERFVSQIREMSGLGKNRTNSPA
ncbi:flippase [bacterium]|nr:flippase [bacterium]